jgi:hypothetical protein
MDAEMNGTKVESEAIRLISEHLENLTQQERMARSILGQVGDERRRFEKALAVLKNEAKPKPKMPKSHTPEGRVRGVSDVTAATILECIREITAEQDEFRQVDVRTRLNMSSGRTALAFERLRQDGLIRFARREGINKYYRLTEEALNAVAE